METTNNLITDIKKQIIAQLNLREMSPEKMDSDAPLFGDGLGLDSIDALELIVLMEKYHGIKIKNPQEAKRILFSVKTMADYIAANK